MKMKSNLTFQLHWIPIFLKKKPNLEVLKTKRIDFKLKSQGLSKT
jgi:hypothetical protein